MFELDDYITKDPKLHKQLVHKTTIDNKIHKDKLIKMSYEAPLKVGYLFSFNLLIFNSYIFIL